MKKLTIIAALVLTGCASTEYEFQDIPEHLLHTDGKYVIIEPVTNPEELKKGPDFPNG